MSKSSGTSGSGQKWQDSAWSQTPPKNGTAAIQYTMDWDSSDVAEDHRVLAERLTESFTDLGDSIKQSFSDHAPASIDCGTSLCCDC
jgi:hypothetical protein